MNDLQPGKELDAEIAEKVMGCKPSKPQPEYNYWYCECRNKAHSAKFNDGHATINFIKPYSTDISAAWEVVEKLKGEKWGCFVWENYGAAKTEAVFRYKGIANVDMGEWSDDLTEGETAPHAICLAALKAVKK